MSTITRCADCDRLADIGAIIPLEECDGLGERLTPGDPVPAGECRACRAFVYLTGKRYVSAPLAASVYPNQKKIGPTLIHAIELNEANETHTITRVLCERVKLESVLDDSALFDFHAVDCKGCLRVIKREGLTLAPPRERR